MMNLSEVNSISDIYNVRTHEVAFGSGDIKLKGRLLYPEGLTDVPGAVLCHGFGTCSRTVEAPAHMLAGRGIAVLIFDFRGHGKSDGIVDENIVEDVVDAWNFMSGCAGIDKERMALAGHSLGAMAAILAAHEVKPRALIALSCPPEINGDISKLNFEVPLELIEKQGHVREYPRDGSIPWVTGLAGIISRLWMQIAGYRVRVDWNKFFHIFSRARLSAIIRELKDCAVLFVHCEGDAISPAATAVALYETARGPKEILISQGGFHSTPLLAGSVRRNWTDWTAHTLRSL
jgi:pimeloyl-ACP methyl ester carboxylesterase